MGKIASLVCLCCFWHSFVVAGLKIQVLDLDGNPVSNAVVSLPVSQEIKPDPEPIASDTEKVAVMDQVDKQFSPHVLLVQPGQPVIFPNSDQVRHHVYSFSKPNDFEIRLYSGDQTDPVIFEHPGIVVLGCNIHDQMVGYLYVQADAHVRISDPHGYVEFDDVPSTPDQAVTIWHSQLSSNKTDKITQILSERNADAVWLLRLELLPEVKKVRRKFKPRY